MIASVEQRLRVGLAPLAPVPAHHDVDEWSEAQQIHEARGEALLLVRDESGAQMRRVQRMQRRARARIGRCREFAARLELAVMMEESLQKLLACARIEGLAQGR